MQEAGTTKMFTATDGCKKAGFFVKSLGGRLKLVKTGFYWPKLAEILVSKLARKVQILSNIVIKKMI